MFRSSIRSLPAIDASVSSQLPVAVATLLIATLFIVLALPLPALGQEAGSVDEQLQQLEQEMERLRTEYEARIATLERRLEELESATRETRAEPSEDSLEAVRAAAREAAGLDSAETAESQPPEPSTSMGGERNLNQLNPEISFSGDILAVASDQQRDEFDAREFEFSFQSALDPFSSAKVFLAVGPEGEVDLEEAYATYNRLPGGLRLKAGKFRQDFGVLNRWHGHALPFSDYPLVLTTFFGEEGLGQTGVGLDWLVPKPWASANELSLQLTDGENEAFGGESFRRLSALLHLKNYWDLDPATYFEWGLSGITGESPFGGSNRIFGTDLTLHWQPPSRAKYRELTFRSEVMLSQRDDDLGQEREAWGLYSYVEALAARNVYLGLRYDWVENPFLPQDDVQGLTANISWWQSEFVRLRGEYGYLDHGDGEPDENRFLLQLTFAAGPHKHENY